MGQCQKSVSFNSSPFSITRGWELAQPLKYFDSTVDKVEAALAPASFLIITAFYSEINLFGVGFLNRTNRKGSQGHDNRTNDEHVDLGRAQQWEQCKAKQ